MGKKTGAARALGVDRGGTHTRIVLVDGKGSELRRLVRPSGGFMALPGLIARTAAAWGVGPEVPAVVATRGAMTRKWRKPFLFRKLAGRIGLVDVISDAEAAYLAAHGESGGAALLIAGTGSVVFLKHAGAFRKFGGNNPPGGDPGSGLWLGSRFLSLAASKRKGLSRRDRAAYARKALELAEAGDIAALTLVRLAQDRLAELLSEASAGRRSREPFRVALAGGLMQNDFFRRGFIRLARELLAPVRIRISPLKCTAETAAARLAARRRAECGK